jgi:hypothetical protein
METLLRFYKKWMKYGFGVVAALTLFLGYEFPNNATKYIGFLVSLFFFVFEPLVSKWLWKIFYSDIDISGVWNARTTYEEMTLTSSLLPEGLPSYNLPKSFAHEIKFYQDCMELKIELSEGENFPRFFSIAANLTKSSVKTEISYAYEVEYHHESLSGCPENKALGIETMTIDRWKELNGIRKIISKIGICKAKPTRMQGRFWHCVRPGGIAYRGSAEFTREI